jgi:hypothetical protein
MGKAGIVKARQTAGKVFRRMVAATEAQAKFA